MVSRKLFYFLILLFLFILSSQLFSNESIEFSFGGGINTVALINISQSDNSGIEFGIPVPMSFIYFPNNNFGIGVSYKITPKISISNNPTFDLDNNISLVHKIGNNSVGKFLLIEYGFISSGKFLLSSMSDNSVVTIGANLIFLGYEKRSPNNDFLFTFGGCMNFRTYSYNNKNIYIIQNGIEFRWRFCFYKELNYSE